ncbi:Transcription elongation factor spt6 [Coemansia interrupta]|uniref:Transcription elongation factor SPT6 n=1 Tax=Coemansia interrupta TaxID=1126814 RepID=A0A9W8LF54_9FUNG|nr:Transcription elongation factor spt6 [Coemansia interrupta]
MSDIDDYGSGLDSDRSRRRGFDSEEESDSYDTRRKRYPDDDDDDEEDDEDDNDDELRRDGFVVDDDDVEENQSDDSAERRRRRKKKKKKRRHHHENTEDGYDDDMLDEEDLALVAENTNQSYESGPSSSSKFKRLKRGRARQTLDDDDDEELRAELDDLADNGSDREAVRGRDYGRDDDRGFIEEDVDELGLFDNDNDRDGLARRARDAADDFEEDDGYGDRPAESRRRYGDEIEAPRRSRIQQESHIGAFVDSIDNIDEDAWMELQEIFGTGEEYSFAMNVQQKDDVYRERTLAEVFEPAELEAKLMTHRDEEIRVTDKPERMQLRASGGDSLRDLSDEEIEEETSWIVRQLHLWISKRESGGYGKSDEDTPFPKANFVNERFLAAVLSVLRLMSQDFCEVPYIARHRREVFVTPVSDVAAGEEPEMCQWLTVGDLWRLYDFDQRFRGLLSARRAANRLIMRLSDASAISSENQEYALDLLASSDSVEEVGDVTEWLQAQYASVIHAWAQSQRTGSAPKRAARMAGAWEQAVRAGVDEFVRASGITARQIGNNIRRPGSHAPADSIESPDDIARVLVGSGGGSSHFATVEAAARAGRAAMAQMIALDPQIRRYVRAHCSENASVVVRPTERGVREINDEEHPAFEFKYLRNKPLLAFVGTEQWLAIDKAAREGLLRVEFSLSQETVFNPRDASSDDEVFRADRDRAVRAISALLEPHVRSDAVHDSAAAWDRLRRQAIQDAVRDHILPLVWREISQRLLAQAFDVMADACRRSLESRIDVQPPRTARMDETAVPCVAVVAGGGFESSSRGALRVVVVDEDGLVREEFSADSMRSNSDHAPGDGVEPLLEAISKHAVNVVAVAGMSLQTKRLFEDVNSLIASRGVDVMVTYADDEVARLWWDSAEAQAELPTLRREERYCVAVARTLQDAANAYASLGARVLSLPLHALQRSVDQGALLTVVERAFVNVVSRVGVDINQAAALAHLQHTVQYVAGLGPRKAQGILSRIGTGDRSLETRSELVTRNLCSRRMFINCASFLRVRPPVEVLDSTLVHPEDYELARKMALDALDIEEDDDSGQRGRKRSDAQSRYVAELMDRSPEKLDELDLGKYADELKRLLGVYKLETLRFIKGELQHPDADARREFETPSDKHVLHMLTGETVGETLREDGTSVVAATVVRVQPRFAIVRLDSGLEGFISIANVSDRRIDEVCDELAPGQAVVAVVKRIDLEKMSLDLSMRPSDVADACARARQPVPDTDAVDRYFDFDAEAALRERAKVRQRKATARMRTIPHPLFKPLNAREAEQYLAARPAGDCVIRPSSRGVDHFAVTWKVAEGLFQHIDVREEGKASDVALGQSFFIDDAMYSALDELVAFHVEPIVKRLDDVQHSAKYYDPEADPVYAAQPVAAVLGPNDYSDDYKRRRMELWDTRTTRHLDALAQSTGRGAYCITLNLAKPGSLTMAFKPTPAYRGIMKWTARVEPNAYRLGERGRYPDINGLIVGFKTMQMNPSAGREASRRDAYGAAGVKREDGRRESSRRDGYGGDSYRGSGDRDRDRDRDRGRDGRDRDYGRAPRHGHSSNSGGGGGWDTGPSSSSNYHSVNWVSYLIL